MWTVYAQGIATYFGRHLSDTDDAVFKHALSTMLQPLMLNVPMHNLERTELID